MDLAGKVGLADTRKPGGYWFIDFQQAIIFWAVNQPPHININRVEVMPVCQSVGLSISIVRRSKSQYYLPATTCHIPIPSIL